MGESRTRRDVFRLLARPRALVQEAFCVADGAYTFAAVDAMAMPHARPW